MAATRVFPDSDFIWPYANPPLYESLWFENFDVVKCRNWMEQNWSISIWICGVYTLVVIAGKYFMKNRKAFDLKNSLAAWNLSMSIFSVIGFARCFPELLHVLRGQHGFHRSICVRDSHTQAAAFWAWAFTLSKVVELGDTLFIIFRKKELKFIHFYHHSIALLMCWCFYSDYEPIARWFGIINFAIHTILYFYLFLKTVDVHMPPQFTKAIIFIELAQMIVGLVVNSYALLMHSKGVKCARSMEGISVQMLAYLSFVLLFIYMYTKSTSKKAGHRKMS